MFMHKVILYLLDNFQLIEVIQFNIFTYNFLLLMDYIGWLCFCAQKHA